MKKTLIIFGAVLLSAIAFLSYAMISLAAQTGHVQVILHDISGDRSHAEGLNINLLFQNNGVYFDTDYSFGDSRAQVELYLFPDHLSGGPEVFRNALLPHKKEMEKAKATLQHMLDTKDAEAAMGIAYQTDGYAPLEIRKYADEGALPGYTYIAPFRLSDRYTGHDDKRLAVGFDNRMGDYWMLIFEIDDDPFGRMFMLFDAEADQNGQYLPIEQAVVPLSFHGNSVATLNQIDNENTTVLHDPKSGKTAIMTANSASRAKLEQLAGLYAEDGLNHSMFSPLHTVPNIFIFQDGQLLYHGEVVYEFSQSEDLINGLDTVLHRPHFQGDQIEELVQIDESNHSYAAIYKKSNVANLSWGE